jgi:hypothetical protein
MGCPACGYSSSFGMEREPYQDRRPDSERPQKLEAAGALPLWVYILTAALAAFVFGLLFAFLR